MGLKKVVAPLAAPSFPLVEEERVVVVSSWEAVKDSRQLAKDLFLQLFRMEPDVRVSLDLRWKGKGG